MIPGYIEKNHIDMQYFKGQEYKSFADFFGRKRDDISCDTDPDVLISPCDSLLSIYSITKDMNIPMKGSQYRLCDIVPDEETAKKLMDGICLVFRLQASDYHHFCAFDDVTIKDTQYIPGELHSVQPIACEKLPVYRLNRRWWTKLDTAHFGEAVQVEVGAMMVGGVHFAKASGSLCRGDEMGNFELAGSTIILMLPAEVKEKLTFEPKLSVALNGESEVSVSIGERIGTLKKAKEV